MSTYKILIGGDFIPSGANIPLFINADVNIIFGEEICQLFSSADFSILNLEGVLTDSNKKQEKIGPRIKAPRQCIKGIKALGVKAVALANNHITDFGLEGYVDTIDALNEANIKFVGSGMKDEIKSFIFVKLGEKQICIYNVSETFFNIPDCNTPGANVYDEYLVCNEIKQLREKSDFLIVIYHGGAEYFQYPTPLVRKRCHRMVDSGADMIFTQHTHCIGCEEHYHNAYILHGQGNFLFARQKMFPHLTKEGLLLELCFTDKRVDVIKHHVCHTGELVRIDDQWDVEGFYSRSNNIVNEELIKKRYQDLKVGEIMNKYLLAAQGTSFFSRFCLRFFPRTYKKHLSNSYTRKQILLNLCVVGQDRRNEDMLGVWEYLLEQST